MMKIEKINDNQIRCTLTRADLASRELKLSELICGSEKAKNLFQDMIKQASHEFGFEAENMPLMIEAIPSSSDSIVLIITKVDDPEELDSKFSKFGSMLGDHENRHDNKSEKSHKNLFDKLDGADHLFDLLNKIKKSLTELDEDDLPFGPLPSKQADSKENSSKQNESKQKSSEKDDSDSARTLSPKVRMFSFSNLDSVIRACRLLKNMYNGANTLYKDTDAIADKTIAEHANAYILVLTQSDHTPDEFFKICNMLSEYGSAESASPATLAFLEEHCEIIVSNQAAQQLGNL